MISDVVRVEKSGDGSGKRTTVPVGFRGSYDRILEKVLI
jgi:hypothetical protein